MSIFISVIIPAKNEEALISGTLEALTAQSYDKNSYEIILVDNGSTDRTTQIARDFAVKVLDAPGVTVGAMRNRGVRHAKGDVFAFIDADCLASADWLTQISQVFSRERCVTGAECDIAAEDGWIAKTWFCLQPKERGAVRCLATNNMAVDRATFEEIEGFNESLESGEDCEFCLRASRIVPVIADPKLKVVHLGTPKTLRQFVRREIWHGIGAFGTFKHNRFDKPLIGTIWFCASICLIVLGFGLRSLQLSFQPMIWLGFSLLLFLLITTVYLRRRYVSSIGHAVRLAYLYFYFFLGRAVALVLILVPGDFYHNNRSKS